MEYSYSGRQGNDAPFELLAPPRSKRELFSRAVKVVFTDQSEQCNLAAGADMIYLHGELF